MRRGNLLTSLIPGQDKEQIDKLVDGHPRLRVERIVSTGQSSPPGFWYNQPDDEFVFVTRDADQAAAALAEGLQLT